jgi:hypothetical protein
MNFLKKIAEGNFDEEVHSKFTRFGKGEYERFLISVKKGKNLKIKCSAGLANTMAGLIADNLKEEAQVKGKVIANYDFENDMPCEVSNFSKRGKLFTAELNTTLSPEQLKEIYEKFKFHFLLLNINSSNFKLKSGKSLPKPGGKIKDNFCSATLPLDLLDEFAFDFDKEFTEVTIKHILHINEVEVPEEYKNDFAKARTHGIRKGVLKRIIEVDEKIIEKEYELKA